MIRGALGRLVGLEGLRAWVRGQTKAIHEDVTAADKRATAAVTLAKTLRKDLAREERKSQTLAAEVERQHGQLAEVSARLARLEALAKANDQTSALVFRSDPSDLAATVRHVRLAIQNSVLEREPGPHVIIDNILPEAAYHRLLSAMPPLEFFDGGAEHTKLDFRLFGEGLAPTASRVIWEAFETEIVEEVLMPALLDLFAPVLEAHYAHLIGPELAAEAAQLPKRASGRIMYRRPGFHQGAHLDPKRSLITGLLYLARPGDNPEYGTQLYSVDRSFTAPSMTTYYLEPDGVPCQVAKRVEYRPNRILAFVNSVAHGADFPEDAKQRERYAYQFYVKPKDGALVKLLRKLPADKQEPWRAVLASHR